MSSFLSENICRLKTAIRMARDRNMKTETKTMKMEKNDWKMKQFISPGKFFVSVSFHL